MTTDIGLYQNFTALLYTDAAFRESFLNAPEPVGLAFGLDTETIWALYNLPLLTFFSRSLLQKRLGIVRELLPALFNEDRKKFEKEYLDYAAQNPLSGELRYAEDALKFCQFLQKKTNIIKREREIIAFEIWKKSRFVRKNYCALRLLPNNHVRFFLKIKGIVLIDF